jgi:histidine triad (HIT) family protein
MSLYGEYDETNVFARILRGELPKVEVFEDEHTFAFMDVMPQSPGHTLVVPKSAKARNLLDLPEGDVAPLFATVQRVAKAIETALSPDGIIITQFNGAPAGQTVFHLHVHIIPRWSDVPMKGHGSAPMADRAGLEAMAARIKAAL